MQHLEKIYLLLTRGTIMTSKKKKLLVKPKEEKYYLKRRNIQLDRAPKLKKFINPKRF
jgi:hypothetical protein